MTRQGAYDRARETEGTFIEKADEKMKAFMVKTEDCTDRTDRCHTRIDFASGVGPDVNHIMTLKAANDFLLDHKGETASPHREV